MSPGWRLARLRLLGEARAALGGAVAFAAAGLLVAVLDLPPEQPGFATSPALSRWTRAVAPGFAIGWWAGLLWTVLLAVRARRRQPPVAPGALDVAAWLAAAFVAAGAALARVAGQPVLWGALAGLLAGTLAAFMRVGRAEAA